MLKYCTQNHCTCCYIDITVHPQSVNTTLNSTINFTCEAVSDDMINLLINNMSVSDVNNRGCTETSGDNSNGKKRQMLLAIAFEDNNNTNISCRLVNGSDKVDNDITVLRIQGELML